MIVKLTLSQIQTVIEQLDTELAYQHQLNLAGCKVGKIVTESDNQVVQLLGLSFQLKNVLLVEQSKQGQARQQAQYLTQRRDMLFDYKLLITDHELNSAIKSIQDELQEVTKSIHFDAKIDVEIDESMHQLLASKNIIN